uniref:SH2B adapter protein 2 n=1 Tax=Phallusia mammillata TaxID=59560 RepID=A0A6F9DRG0_9ASCI|nr:SH2B adapter protein 2 [Phallusia mammillata]
MDGTTSATLTSNASALLNDWKFVQLYESQAFINARRLILALQPFLEQYNICTFQASLFSLISERYVAHFQDCFLRESHRLENLNNGMVSIEHVHNINHSGKNFCKDMQSDFDRFLMDAAKQNGIPEEKTASNGSVKQICETPLPELFPANKQYKTGRRMSADDVALQQIDEATSTDVFLSSQQSKKKKSKKRNNSQKVKSRTRSEEDSGVYRENGDASNKSNFVSNVWNRLRRGSTSRIKGLGFPMEKPQDVAVRIDMAGSYLVIGQTQPGENMAFQRARLVLTQIEKDYYIEIFCPIKSTKPKITIMGCDITEVRPTTALSMPDVDYTFVIKASGEEYVVKLNGDLDFATWLSEIEECTIKAGHKKLHAYECHKLPFLPERLRESPPNSGTDVVSSDDTGQQLSDFSTTPPNLGKPELTNGVIEDADTESISTTQLGSWDSNATAPLLSSSTTGEEGDDESKTRNQAVLPGDLVKFPWYHKSMTRMKATQLVLGARHGVFLMRLSETRQSGHVLTFNFQGRAKHLRLSVDSEGRCRVQHFKFNSVLDMLEQFRSQPIPLESGGTTQVCLTDYVINENCDSRTDPSDDLRVASASSTSDASDAQPSPTSHVNGSASPSTNQHSPPVFDPDVPGPSGLQSINVASSSSGSPSPMTSPASFVDDVRDVTMSSHVRAVDNQYAFS